MTSDAAFQLKDQRQEAATQQHLQETINNSSHVKQLQAIRTLSDNRVPAPVAQLKIPMKDEDKPKAKRTTGDTPAIQAEVAATIARGDYMEIVTDITNLSTSISNRTDENGNFVPHTPSWVSHKDRITDEKDCRKLLEAEKTRLESLRKKPAKAVMAPSNPFDLLGDEDDGGDGDEE